MKKVLSLLLSLVMLLSVTSGMTMTVQASGFTPRTTAPSASQQWYKDYHSTATPSCVSYVKARASEILGCSYSNYLASSGNYGGKNWWETTTKLPKGQTPMPGAIMCWNSHVAVVEKVNNGTIEFSEANSSYRASSGATTTNVVLGTSSGTYFDYRFNVPVTSSGAPTKGSDSGFLGYIYLVGSGSSSTGNNPTGNLDIVEGKCGQIFVRGWAFDKDNTSQALSIHVYVGAGSTVDGGEGHAITANTERSDVNNVYGCGNKHGFSHTIDTNRTGSQTVYVYAINIGGGSNVLLGSKTVNISNPNPNGALDIVEGKCGAIFVRGWAFDPNDTSKALSIHVYVGAGSTADGGEGHIITANTERKDVNNLYNCGNNHGYSHTINVNKNGSQTIFVYAINIGSGSNVLLGSKTVTIRAGHSWDGGTVTKAATCTEAGVKTYTCSACGGTKTEAIEATGHDWDDGEVTTPATESENGIMTYTCRNCNDTKEVVIPVLAHTHTPAEAVIENNIAPTCTESGSYDSVVYCTLGDEYEFSRETVTVPATGHSFTNYVSNCDATCSSDGTKTAKCDNCDATDTVVDEGTMLGHDYVSFITNSTCVECGYTTYVCTVCGDSFTSDYTDKSEHTIVFDEAVVPTCTENGVTAGAHCSVCGKVFIAQDAIDALGHKWNAGVVKKQPTMAETGKKEYKCTVCGATKTETLAKLEKKANTLTVTAKKPKVKYSKLKKKSRKIALKKAMAVSNAQGTVTFIKSGGNKKITVNKKTGEITVKKGLKKGTYKVKIKVKAAGNATYKSAVKTVTVVIKIK